MERTTVYLTEAQKRRLQRAAKLTGRSEAELIREGVDVVTTRHQAAEPRLPLFESGQPDLAEVADRLRRRTEEGWDPAAIAAEEMQAQQERLFIQAAHEQGTAVVSWDCQPLFAAARQYPR